MEDAAAILRDECESQITLGDLARRLASSPRQLRRAFAEAGRTSFRAYLREVRMQRAAELLASTDLGIGEIGERVGYCEASQFTKAFKRIHRVTPSEFRTTHKGSVEC